MLEIGETSIPHPGYAPTDHEHHEGLFGHGSHTFETEQHCGICVGHQSVHQPLTPDSDLNSNLPTDFSPIGREGKAIRKVLLKLLCLEWGGEYLDNPCQLVTGFVLDIVQKGRDGKCSFLIDFRADLGIQIVPTEDC
jgi:hypothetical protein